MATVTALPVRDRTNAERQRRFRERRRRAAAVTVDAPARNGAVTVSTADMCRLGARLRSGTVTADDLRLADKLIMALVNSLPPDSSIDIGGEANE